SVGLGALGAGMSHIHRDADLPFPWSESTSRILGDSNDAELWASASTTVDSSESMQPPAGESKGRDSAITQFSLGDGSARTRAQDFAPAVRRGFGPGLGAGPGTGLMQPSTQHRTDRIEDSDKQKQFALAWGQLPAKERSGQGQTWKDFYPAEH